MSCGELGWACVLLQWALSEIGQATTLDWLKVAVGLGGLAFGIYRWWHAAERNMHKRLGEYLANEDRRLRGAQRDLIAIMERPTASARGAAAPLFSVKPLRMALRSKNWHRIGSDDAVERAVSRHLLTAIRRLENQIETSSAVVDNYRSQLAGARALSGAIASAKAENAWTASSRLPHDSAALAAFQKARQVPGFQHDIDLLQMEAHQLRRLGHANQSAVLYKEIERLSLDIQQARRRDLIIANAKRWRATIVQAKVLAAFEQNRGGPQGALLANTLMIELGAVPNAKSESSGALDLRQRYAPFRDWDAIDQADMCYQTAFFKFKIGARVMAQTLLESAEIEYRSVLTWSKLFRGVAGRKSWKLREAARKGLKRVKQAQETEAYDTYWLLPPITPVDDRLN